MVHLPFLPEHMATIWMNRGTGVPCTHLNDDRRVPLLWTKGGVAQTLVDPNEPFWYRLEDCGRVPDGKMFKDFATLGDMGPETRAKYHHCGLVPEFPAAPVEEVQRRGSGGVLGQECVRFRRL